MNTSEYARYYIGEAAFAVFPVWGIDASGCHCSVSTCKSPGKHPVSFLVPNGVKNATTLIEEWEWWAEEYEDRYGGPPNIGIATGAVSGIVVLDIDIDDGGEESFAELLQRYYPDVKGDGIDPQSIQRYDLPVWTRAVRTGGGGLHLYYRYPGSPVRNSAGTIGKGIDVRGDGGYVLAPPSVHETGAWYEWDEGDGLATDLSPMPEWLTVRSQVQRTPVPAVKISGTYHRPPITEPGRNVALTRIAGGIWGGGASPHELRTQLHRVNRESCIPPLSDSEVDRIVQSVERYAR